MDFWPAAGTSQTINYHPAAPCLCVCTQPAAKAARLGVFFLLGFNGMMLITCPPESLLANDEPDEFVIDLPDHETKCPGGKCPSCGCLTGVVHVKNGQDVVRCEGCRIYLLCIPKTLSGRKERSLSTTHKAIKPKQRSRILQRATGRCETCGSRSGVMHVGHVVSVADGHANGLSDSIINSDENLICQCAECNAGLGKSTIPLRMYIAILNARNAGN